MVKMGGQIVWGLAVGGKPLMLKKQERLGKWELIGRNSAENQ
ncbi:hypothetical protein KIS4809_1328 [Bacillus sp. ZZV12-4809]|nr:hypothetical protein [Cytobacillus sp. AMY 15.2]KAF0820056.1 hypothetical protein KIS4809_1328 [Bacillus sp. ZZV12-4809]